MKRFLIVINLILIFSGVAIASEKKLVKIDIRNESVIGGNIVYLKDIAVLTGADKGLIEKLSNLPVLKRMPQDITKPVTIRKNNITSALRQNRVNLKDVELVSPAQVTVFRKYKTIDKSKVFKLIESIIFEELEFDREYIKLSRYEMPEMVIPEAPYTIKVKDYYNNNYKNKTKFSFSIFINEKLFKVVNAYVFIDELTEVPIVNKNLVKGTIITEEDLDFKKVKKSIVKNSVYGSEVDVLGRMLTRNKVSGDLIRKRDVRDFFPVSKGSKVVILAESAFIKISCNGIANERGKIGDMIKVLNTKSKKVIFARVLDESTVTVEF